MSKHIHNHKFLKERRKTLRNNMTKAEVLLWIKLKGKKLSHRKFRRQHSIGKYIVDFYCPSERLIIELEGAVHNNPGQIIYDHDRKLFLENLGFNVICFDNDDVELHCEAVLEEITRNFDWQKCK